MINLLHPIIGIFLTSNGFTNRSRSNTALRIFQLALDAQKIDLFANQPKNACHHTIDVMGMMIVETTVTRIPYVQVIQDHSRRKYTEQIIIQVGYRKSIFILY